MTLADFKKSASTGTSTSEKLGSKATVSGWSVADLRRDSESKVAPKVATTQGLKQR